MLAKSFGDAKKGTEQQQQHQLPPKKHKLRHLPRIEINWCCSLPFNVIFISLLVLVVLVSSVPMWTGSQVLLYDSQSKGAVVFFRSMCVFCRLTEKI